MSLVLFTLSHGEDDPYQARCAWIPNNHAQSPSITFGSVFRIQGLRKGDRVEAFFGMAVRLRAEKASVRVPHVAEEDRCPPEARKFCRASPKPEHFCKLPSPASVHSWLWGSPAHGAVHLQGFAKRGRDCMYQCLLQGA